MTTEEIKKAGIEALDALWQTRVEFGDNAGFASFRTVDMKHPQLFGNEAGAAIPAPEWCFQAREGIPGAIYTYIQGFATFRRPLDLERAKTLGDTLLWVQSRNNGGWFQDGIVADGKYKNVQAWGEKHHAEDDLQGLATLDDSTSTSCALSLLLLFLATGETKFLDGAKRFGNELVALSQRPEYRRGGCPQAFPFDIAANTKLNQNLDERNPDRPYLTKKTLNDHVMRDAVWFMHRLFEVTQDQQYRNFVTLQLGWLSFVKPKNGGWAQQYNASDQPCWGRHKEPPAFAPCENGIMSLFVGIHPRVDASLQHLIDAKIGEYLAWLEKLPKGKNENHIHRYYNAKNEPVWANNYQFVGSVEEAGKGQPNEGGFDYGWVIKSKIPNWRERYMPDLDRELIGFNPVPPARVPEFIETQENGVFVREVKDRKLCVVAHHCGILLGLFRYYAESLADQPEPEPNPQPNPEPQPDPIGEPPALAIRVASDNKVRTFSGATSYDNEYITAEVSYVGDSIWKLALTAKVNLSSVMFPFSAEPLQLGEANEENYTVWPHRLGHRLKADESNRFAWWGLPFPSGVAPLVARYGKDEAVIYAQADFPPQPCQPMGAGNGLYIKYGELNGGWSIERRAMIIKSRSANGNPAWAVACDKYRDWLVPQLIEAGVRRETKPLWYGTLQGIRNVQLENRREISAERWREYVADGYRLGMILQWGQFSDYRGSCCQDSRDIHHRYLPWITDESARAARSVPVGYYTRSPEGGGSPASWGDRWKSIVVGHFNDYGANAVYIDVYGYEDELGDIIEAGLWLLNETPMFTVIEGASMFYDVPGLTSGTLTWKESPRETMPEFGRMLMPDQVLIQGQSNGDHKLWGAANDHVCEREAFLLGLRLDVINSNEVVDRILDERERTLFFASNPVYRHTEGLSDVDDGARIRVFKCDNWYALAIENWEQRDGLTYTFNGEMYDVPFDQQLSIAVFELKDR